MKWTVEFTEDAQKDLDKLDGSSKVQVLKAINKVSQNPLPQNEGGYGKPLGNKAGKNLTGLMKIKLKKLGIRIVYQLVQIGNVMKIIVIEARADEEVYGTAAKRIKDE